MSDLINRQDAIDGADEIIKRDTSGNNAVVEAMKAWKAYIGNLPSAERKRGKWELSRRDENVYDIRGNRSWANWYRCSNCRFTHEFIENHIGQYNYCPQCGAYMRGDTDE